LALICQLKSATLRFTQHPQTFTRIQDFSIMVLVDFTLIERWRIFGELSLRTVQPTARPERAIAQPASITTPEAARPARYATDTDPQESPARRQSEAALMQRLL